MTPMRLERTGFTGGESRIVAGIHCVGCQRKIQGSFEALGVTTGRHVVDRIGAMTNALVTGTRWK